MICVIVCNYTRQKEVIARVFNSIRQIDIARVFNSIRANRNDVRLCNSIGRIKAKVCNFIA